MKILVLFMIFTSWYGVSGKNLYKLPRAVRPYHYKLTFYPDFYNKTPDQFLLHGRATIYAKVVQRTRYFCLHAFNLTLGSMMVIRNGQDLLQGMRYDEDKQWFLIFLKGYLNRGDKIKIKIKKYHAPIQHNLRGLYYYSRNNSDGEKIYGITTQMEATHARYAFPSFDEPALKATFSISILRKKPFFSLSNAPLDRQVAFDSDQSYVMDFFKTTPIMSTYIVAVIVTDYKSLSEMHRGVNFTIYYPPGREDEVQLSMKISRKSFDYLEDYFGIKYPLPKLDQIGFASKDFLYGGMENYGMIIYNERAIYSNRADKKTNVRLVGIILHEIVHQWFGNLVTMKWWDDLWLNEGMTQFFSIIRKDWFSEYHLASSGLLRVLRAMTGDMSPNVAPVYVPWAKSPSQITSLVNGVTYSKGGSVIKMAELIMGKDVFRDAMRTYVRRHMYGSVTHSRLFEAFTETNKKHRNGLDMGKILTPWLKQPGFPVVNVTINERTATITYEQSLYYARPSEYENMPTMKDHIFHWPIPIQWKTGNKGMSRIIVRFEKRGTVALSQRLYPSDWLVVNPEGNFYYVVNYGQSHWRKLGRILAADHLAIDQLCRVKLIFDAFMLYRATKHGRGNFMDSYLLTEVMSFIRDETDDFPLKLLTKVIYPRLRRDRRLDGIFGILRERQIIKE